MIQAVEQFFRGNQQPTIRKCAANLKTATGLVWNILHKKLDFKAYKIWVHQQLNENDINTRMTFEAGMREKLEDGSIDFNKIWFSDEAHFYLHDYVNRQNFRI